MKSAGNWIRIASVLLTAWMLSLYSCSPVQLTSAWSDKNAQPAGISRILVVSFAKDSAKRKFGEDHIKAEILRHRLVAFASLDVFGPGFAAADSVTRRRLLLENKFDGLVTFRIINVQEDYQWQLNTLLTKYPVRSVVEQDVQMGSELYRVKDNKLIWWGRSISSSTDPTEMMAEKYARNIVRDMIKKKVLLKPRSTSPSAQ
jgi:hypothetical protein